MRSQCIVREAEFSALRLEIPDTVSSPNANSMHGRSAALVSASISGVRIVAPVMEVKCAPMERAGEWLYSKFRMSLHNVDSMMLPKGWLLQQNAAASVRTFDGRLLLRDIARMVLGVLLAR